ncbi:MAG: hypothetical protein GY809_24955, partial [Planctomycetes bacterium]|nr:hypothetical protein [Planctomycetota bacterium]
TSNFETVYKDALNNLRQINIVQSQGTRILRAGSNYGRPWTRDGSLNCLCAASLLEPDVAQNTLWFITEGNRVAGQWWDRTVWIIAAWEHFKITGSETFLLKAYTYAKNTLTYHEGSYYNPEYGLFRGLSHLCDGIAGYPSPPAPAGIPKSSFAGDYPGVDTLMPTSIQAIYYGAYRAVAAMAERLGKPRSEIAGYRAKALRLKTQADQHLWVPRHHRYGYFIHGTGSKAGVVEHHQEGAGLAFSLWFGLADDAKAKTMMKHFHNQPYGMTCVWPHFKRFNDAKPGRHNVVTWPQMSAYWALGALSRGGHGIFKWELENVMRLLHSTSPDIREIYNSMTGKPEGGWQNGMHWDATHNQTWCATGYIGMIHRGVFGMTFHPDGITFRPYLAAEWGACSLSGLRYRDMTLNIRLTGSGTSVSSFKINGSQSDNHFLNAGGTGEKSISITLK